MRKVRRVWVDKHGKKWQTSWLETKRGKELTKKKTVKVDG